MNYPKTRAEANAILECVKKKIGKPSKELINYCLILTGDLVPTKPEKANEQETPDPHHSPLPGPAQARARAAQETPGRLHASLPCHGVQCGEKTDCRGKALSAPLNCRPGDLAIIIGASSEAGKSNIGRIVRVIAPAKPGFFRGWRFAIPRAGFWFVESAGADLVAPLEFHGTALVSVAAAHDAHLRPIRNPGDDATDESAAWLPPVPAVTVDEVTA